MNNLELLDRETWREFLGSPAAVLMLGKSDCDACAAWTQELKSFLADDTEWSEVRFGKLELDRGGLGAFKKENPWLADIKDLPYTLVYVNGERKKEFLGSGIDRLVNRMRRVIDSPA
ncbi:MAG TPA: hypothetical protein DCE39_13935 [Planctomycetaceae bacterium]|nr:hypothetical protein [Planctomycetaceae bacterium]HAA62020.1 hypothetical protein [Planctomycetaceae bacterium]|tara:strand:+ start:3835 stop:4185 length:351 start_codon:yes stop_codon:yes gene_type:complete